MTIPSLTRSSSIDDLSMNSSYELATQDSIEVQTTKHKKKKNKNKAKNKNHTQSTTNSSKADILSTSTSSLNAVSTQPPPKSMSSKAMMEKDGFKIVTRGSTQIPEFQSISPTMSILMHQLEEHSEPDNELDEQVAAALTVEDDFGGFLE